MVPSLESEYGEDMLKSDSSLGESKYYNTKLMVGIGEELTLNEAAGGQGSAADGQGGSGFWKARKERQRARRRKLWRAKEPRKRRGESPWKGKR